MMKKISIVTPCFNEATNLPILYERISKVLINLEKYDYEIIFIDNCSTDGSREVLRKFAEGNKRVKLIFNSRNFGHIRSPYYGLTRASGDAVVYLASDLQDPPELIEQFIENWESGSKLVLAIKPKSSTNPIMHFTRRLYYKILDRISEIDVVKDFTGFGLYDKTVVNYLQQVRDPYPFLRGIISEVGFPIKTIEFEQPARKFGVSKNNFYTLYDIAWLGLISNSKVPIRIASMAGFLISAASFLAALIYIGIKLLYWRDYPIGVAPLIIIQLGGIGLILLFMGIVGEYIGSMHTFLRDRPLVVVDEEINF